MNKFLLALAGLLEKYDAEIEANNELKTEIMATEDGEYYHVVSAHRFTAKICRDKASEFGPSSNEIRNRN